MRIITYNINGIRAAIGKGLFDWIRSEKPDVLCLQEIKASPEQVGLLDLEEMGYHHYWYPAQKKGYSGVAIFSKIKPDHVEFGCGMPIYDNEGRVIRADFGKISVMSVYHPSGSSGDERQNFKMKWLDDFHRFAKSLEKDRTRLVISGDYNICHRAIDIHNPISNVNTSGFKPEEREWMENFIQSGYVDTFRHFNPDPHHYSWWSYRANARAKNLGWRIDYNMVTKNLESDLVSSSILSDVKHSDHCPVSLEIKS